MAQITDRTVNIDKLVGLCPYVTMQKCYLVNGQC